MTPVAPIATQPLAEGESRFRHAAHASIAVTFVGGPQSRYTVACCFRGTHREVRELTYGAADYATAAALGNALHSLFQTLTIQQALDALPQIQTVLSLAA